MKTNLGLIAALLLASACGGGSQNGTDSGDGSDGSDGSGAPGPVAGSDQTIVALDGMHVYFAGEDNRRTVDVPVTFPPAGHRFTRVTLRFALRCPDGGCDYWDRLGHLALVRGAGTPGEQVVEFARFITPYRVAGAWELDVTDLQRLFEGDVTFRVFIDTWVGPGHAQGAGWLVDAAFDFVGGLPSPDPFAVAPVFTPATANTVYGDPARATAATATVPVPAGAGAARVLTLITGHGQGNAGNCAEFCAKQHTLTEATAGARPRMVWREDCATAGVPGQQGTFQYPRAGWCPGAMVAPWIEDFFSLGAELALTLDVEPYENTCRPDAAQCSGCALGTGCAYDGGAHTEPRYERSALVVFYR